MHPEIERRIRSALPRFFLPWAGMIGSSLALAGLGVFLSANGILAKSGSSLWTVAAIAAGAFCGGAILFLNRRLFAPGWSAGRLPGPDPEHALRHLLVRYLVLWSCAEVPGILGFAQLLIGGSTGNLLLLCGVSVGILAYLMPARGVITSRLEEVERVVRTAPPAF